MATIEHERPQAPSTINGMRHLQESSPTKPLTGLPNKHHFASWINTILQPFWNATTHATWTATGTTANVPHKAFELPDRVNNLFAIIFLLAMEWSAYLHIERHDWVGAAAVRTHPRPRNRRKLLTSNPVCERKSQHKAKCARQATASVHVVVVAMGWERGVRHSIGLCGNLSR